jgi:aryl sulfotransferase
MILWILLGLVVVFILGLVVWRVIFMMAYNSYSQWEMANRRGLAYYGKPVAARHKFRDQIVQRSKWLLPMVRFEASLNTTAKSIPSIEYTGVTGPAYSCTVETFQACANYQPTKEDVFIVTQMKCGTTWLQQVAYEVIMHGQGNLNDDGHVHMYAVSPWIEALDSVSLANAPLIGPNKRRVIKTHMPTKLLPYSPTAKYLYITRNPVACFASIVDYFDLMAGPFVPPRKELLDWYCSDKMWWLSWPDHVAGYWDWTQMYPNVLFVHFEEMKRDLEGTVRKVAKFLDEPLSDDEVSTIIKKSSFQWMKDHEELFEMCPPNMFSVTGTYFKSGAGDRDKDVSDEYKQRILQFCREKLAGRNYPAAKFYPALGPTAPTPAPR